MVVGGWEVDSGCCHVDGAIGKMARPERELDSVSMARI